MNLKVRLDETVYDLMMEGFFEGRYQSGQKIEPNDLATRFSISRTPVVQALKRLAGDGILYVNSTGKYYIPVPTVQRLHEVCGVRILLEQYAVALHVAHPDPEILQQLKHAADRCSEEMEHQNAVESVKNDLSFHRQLVELTGNQCLYDAYMPVLRQFIGIKYSIKHQYDMQEMAAVRHQEMIRYIMDGDEQNAKESLWNHIELSRKRMESIIKQEN